MVPAAKPSEASQAQDTTMKTPPVLPAWDEQSKQIGSLKIMKDVVQYVPLLSWAYSWAGLEFRWLCCTLLVSRGFGA